MPIVVADVIAGPAALTLGLGGLLLVMAIAVIVEGVALRRLGSVSWGKAFGTSLLINLCSGAVGVVLAIAYSLVFSIASIDGPAWLDVLNDYQLLSLPTLLVSLLLSVIIEGLVLRARRWAHPWRDALVVNLASYAILGALLAALSVSLR